MNRKQMIDFINTEVLPGAEIADWEWMKYGTEIVGKIIKAIERWRIGKPANIHMVAHIYDGVLWINDKPIKRVAAKLPRETWSKGGYYWEGRCIAKGETEYD